MSDQAEQPRSSWAKAWPDALAFAGGLAIAWFAKWETTDLVWSLWLSSLVVGYSMIVWIATRSLREFATGALQDKTPGQTKGKLLGGVVLLCGSLFLIAFFTVHFGGFHYGHSVFLSGFFPIEGAEDSWPTLHTYWIVVKDYWIFLPAAFIAERAGFADKLKAEADVSVTADVIRKRKARNAMGGDMMAPYKNVIRMHLLIFFFAGASFANIDGFYVYAVVYAVYFFPWRLLRRERV